MLNYYNRNDAIKWRNQRLTIQRSKAQRRRAIRHNTLFTLAAVVALVAMIVAPLFGMALGGADVMNGGFMCGECASINDALERITAAL